MRESSDKPPKKESMPLTDWRQLRQLKVAAVTEHQELLELLTRKYRAPVFQYLLCQGRTQFDAEDLLQDFFCVRNANPPF